MKNTFKGKHGPLLIAEIGGNHEGNFEYAKYLTKLAVNSGVDFVKHQIYKGDSLVSSIESPERNKHFKQFELSNEQHIELARTVLASNKGYTASIWDMDSFQWIDEYISIYKIGSGDLTSYPFLNKIAKIGKPIILSTGLSTEEEILDSVNYIQTVNGVYTDKEMLAILQCTSMYPINNTDANLNVIKRIKSLTGLSVGYSDHTEGIKALKYAAAMGADILEFHFTDDRENKNFRDHKVSLTPYEVIELIDELEFISSCYGDEIKKPLSIEIDNGHVISFRRAVYPSRNINEGEIITEENITVLRPNVGIDAREYFNLIGKKSRVPLNKHQKLRWEYFE